MNSWEEDALFRQWGWEKDLIRRQYVAPDNRQVITFDQVMLLTESAEGENTLTQMVREFGQCKS